MFNCLWIKYFYKKEDSVKALIKIDTSMVEGNLVVVTATTNCLAPSVSEPVITKQSWSSLPTLILKLRVI
jgi:hypothetical protein